MWSRSREEVIGFTISLSLTTKDFLGAPSSMCMDLWSGFLPMSTLSIEPLSGITGRPEIVVQWSGSLAVSINLWTKTIIGVKNLSTLYRALGAYEGKHQTKRRLPN